LNAQINISHQYRLEISQQVSKQLSLLETIHSMVIVPTEY